ncbi:hypothetical protein EXIGLDRAFT_620735, partial [Exidia glandulosa HHB12029]
TIAQDATSHKHRSYTVHNIAIVERPGAAPRKYFGGATTSFDHTAQTTVKGWVSLLNRSNDLHNNSPLGSHARISVPESLKLIRGMTSDHASGEKLTHVELQALRCDLGIEELGENWLKSLPETEWLVIMCEQLPLFIDEIGGSAYWQMLPANQQAAHYSDFYRRIARQYGAERFEQLPDDQKRVYDLFLWTGCAMHKDLNAVKGGCSGLADFWPTVDTPGPRKQPNKANAAALTSEHTDVALKASDDSYGGAVKLIQNCGLTFKNKNPKAGQQESFKLFFEDVLDVAFSFPDASNIRFQCYCSGSRVIIIHLSIFISFMEQIRDEKSKGPGWTNLELNIFLSLQDLPTQTELVVLALYAEAICHPYIAPGTNALNLGWLYIRIQVHCQLIIDEPDRLIGPYAADLASRGTLDGNRWEHPELLDVVCTRFLHLPELRGALIAYFKRVKETFLRFAAEYEVGGSIDTLSDAERSTIFIPSTNDWCEGECGAIHNSLRTGNVSLNLHNARAMFARNGTSQYMEELSDDVLKYVQQQYRLEDASGDNKKQRRAEVVHKKELAIKGAQKTADRLTKAVEAQAAIDETEPRLEETDAEVREKPGTVTALKTQLRWFKWSLKKRNSKHAVPPFTKLKKTELVEALIAARDAHRVAAAAVEVSDQSEGVANVAQEMDFTEMEVEEEAELE